jgi:pimeloyl-ACP methyl ester carboxylesterase
MKSVVAKKSILHVPGGAKPSLLVPPPDPMTKGANDLYALDGQYVCIHLPVARRTHDGPMRLLVVVHGYSASQNSAKGRQAVRRFASFWGQRVAEHKWAVLAPHFDEKRFQKDYQRLNRFGLRADVRLNQLVDAAALMIPCLETENCFLLGFSGGGQFVHRYAAFHGNRFSRMVVGAPGWFVWPDPWLLYPLGLGEPYAPEKGRERLQCLCRQNMLVLVGENDHTQGAFRENFHMVDLCQLQGRGRRERAANWFLALKQMADKEHIRFRSQLRILKRTAHRINDRFAHTAIAFLAGKDEMI